MCIVYTRDMDFTVAVNEREVAGVKRNNNRAAYVTVTELARMAQVHRNTIHLWIRQGHLTARRVGLARRSPLLISREEAGRVLRDLGLGE